jgi:tetratricopeptide (TPR) repeat protein
MSPAAAADNPVVTPFPWNISAADGGPAGGLHSPAPGAWDALLRAARAGRALEAVAALEDRWAASGTSPGGCARGFRSRLLADAARDAAAAGEDERALELFEQAAADAPALAEMYSSWAGLLRKRGDEPAARSALAAGWRAEPGNPACAVEHVLLEARSGRLGEAVGELEALGRARPPADAGLFRGAMARLRAGEWEAAEGLLSAAYRLGPHSLAAALRTVGRSLEEGDPARALEGAVTLTERFPGAPAAHAAVGLACLALGWSDDALEAFGRAVECDPDHHEARLYLAWTLFLGGETSAAENEVLLVLAACPGHELALGLWRERCGSRPASRPAMAGNAPIRSGTDSYPAS